MTVRQLIDLLERYPSDTRVVVNGYEQGYDDLFPSQISVARIALNTGVYEWEGRHGDEDEVPAERGEAITTVNALVLGRSSN